MTQLAIQIDGPSLIPEHLRVIPGVPRPFERFELYEPRYLFLDDIVVNR